MKQIPLPFADNIQESSGSKNPLPMQYLGSKTRIAPWIMEQIHIQYPNVLKFVDLFAGTGSVSLAANDCNYRLLVNDVQPYAYVLLRSLFQESRTGLQEVQEKIGFLTSEEFLLASDRGKDVELLKEEKVQFEKAGMYNWKWERYRDFCEATSLVKGTKEEAKKLKKENGWNLFIKYYANTYFGVEQCFQLDALREFADSLSSESARNHVLAATIAAMTFAVSSTTHLAQYLKPTSRKTSLHLIQRRQVSLIEEVRKRLVNLIDYPVPQPPAMVYQSDSETLLAKIPLDERTVVYIDPPYFKEHYSRYYHVLDTFYLYDYPLLTYNERLGSTTVGRYREDRIVSDFGLKGSVQGAFSKLFEGIRESGAKGALSYANTSLVAKKQLIELANGAGLKATVREIELMHSGQGQPRNKVVTEYLFLLEPKSI